jgi:serine/threonine protein kinase/tetratricopeptide (TPR) repeat protein
MGGAPGLMSSGLFAGRYRIERVLGRGATATVHLARDSQLGQSVALKILRPELAQSTVAQRFVSEIRRTTSLHHPRILTVLDSGEHEGQLYFALPYMEGGTLRKRLDHEKQLSIEDAVTIAAKVADALDYAHQRGLIHRDVKPENILFSQGEVFLGDFGIARALEQVLDTTTTSTGTVRGTPAYMSPEQASGSRNLDGRTDIYSLACVVYEMIAGIPAFVGPTAESIISQRFVYSPRELRVYRPTVSLALEAEVAKGLMLVPADRHKTAGEFGNALAAAANEPAPSGTISGGAAVRRPQSFRWGRLLAIAAPLAAIVAWQVWLRTNSTPRLNVHSIAVAPFDVIGTGLGDSRINIADQVSRTIDGLAPLRSVSSSGALAAWQGPADLAAARELAQKTGAGMSIVGSVHRLSVDSVRITGMIYDVLTESLLGEASVVGPELRLPELTDSLVIEFLRVLSRARRISPFRVPTVGRQIPTLKAYLSGEHHFRRTNWDSAQMFFERAVELDPSFALAYHRLYVIRSMKGSGIDTLVWFQALHAGRLNRGLSPRDSLMITADSLRAAIWLAYGREGVFPTEQRRRLYSLLDVATRRFPEDAEVWYQTGLVHYELPTDRRSRLQRSLSAFDRAIALDSTFGPAFVYAIELATFAHGRVEGMRYVDAFLRLNPTGIEGEAARLTAKLARESLTQSEVDNLLRAASVLELFKAFQPITWWTDSSNLAIHIASEIARRGPEAAQLAQSPTFTETMQALSYAYRGRVKEAYASMTQQPNGMILPDLAFVGGADRSTATHHLDQIIRSDEWRPRFVMPALAWWHSIGDTVALQQSLQRITNALRSMRPGEARQVAAFMDGSVRGLLALSRADTALAVSLLINVPDSLCYWCNAQQLITARIAAAIGRRAEAREILDRRIPLNDFATAGLMRYERARLAEQLGDTAAARSDYQHVAEIWSNADPHLRVFADTASARLQRLGGSRR